MTISLQNGSAVCYKHNSRDTKFCEKEKHIDLTKTHENWKSEKLADAYHRLFDDSVKEYNSRQKRPERQIKNYLDTVSKKNKQHAVYECIVQVGSKDVRCDEQTGKKVLKEYVDSWAERNPSLALIGAYYHADEEGAPHVHIDYVPVATGYKNGMKKQAGLAKAFEQMNLKPTKVNGKFVTGQIIWQQRERDALADLCRQNGLQVEHGVSAGRQHKDTDIYKREKAVEEQEQKINQERSYLDESYKFFERDENNPFKDMAPADVIEKRVAEKKTSWHGLWETVREKYAALKKLAAYTSTKLLEWRFRTPEQLEDVAQAYRKAHCRNGLEYNEYIKRQTIKREHKREQGHDDYDFER